MDKFKTCIDKVDIKSLAFLYGLMGWETVSSIFGFSKILFWERLNKQPNRKELLGVFEKLGSELEVPCCGPHANSGIVPGWVETISICNLWKAKEERPPNL